MREAVYHHALTLPLTYYRNIQPGAVVNAVINELTLPGNFIGMVVASAWSPFIAQAESIFGELPCLSYHNIELTPGRGGQLNRGARAGS